MNKKDLLTMKHLIATEAMIKAAKDDKKVTTENSWTDFQGKKHTYSTSSYTYYYFFTAIVVGAILKVSAFTRARIMRGNREPQFEIFIDRGNNKYITYEPEVDKWRTAKIDMLSYDSGNDTSYVYAKKNFQPQEARDIVNEYFATGMNKDIREAVLDFQSTIKKDALRKKHKNELEEIDSVMNEVPDLPKDFDSWVIKNCFKETMFYQKEKPYSWPNVYCTHCEKWMPAPATNSSKPEHGKEVICPECKTNAVYRSWNKQKYVNDSSDVVILQKLIDKSGYILRKFECSIKRRHEKGWENLEFNKHEILRQKLNNSFVNERLYEYGEYKYTGIYRWCYQCRRSQFSYYSHDFGTGLMFTKNLKRELKNEAFVNVDFKRFFMGGSRRRIDPGYILRRLQQYPIIEYLMNSGLSKLSDEIMENKENRSLFDHSVKRVHDALRLDKQRMYRLKKFNGGSNVLAALQYERGTGSRVTDENIKFIQDNKVDISKLEMNRTGMTLQKTLNFLERQQKMHGYDFGQTRRYFTDYLDMAEDRGLDLNDEIVCKNARMMEFHNKYLKEKNRKEKTSRDKDVNQRFEKIKEDYKQNTEHFGFETKEYAFIAPRCAADITKEGRRLHHCVGASDNYIRSMNQRNHFIIFLRRITEKSKPYYTIEVDWDGKVIQYFSAYDRKPDIEKIDAAISEWKAAIDERNRKEEKNLRIKIQAAG